VPGSCPLTAYCYTEAQGSAQYTATAAPFQHSKATERLLHRSDKRTTYPSCRSESWLLIYPKAAFSSGRLPTARCTLITSIHRGIILEINEAGINNGSSFVGLSPVYQDRPVIRPARLPRLQPFKSPHLSDLTFGAKQTFESRRRGKPGKWGIWWR
jgi:hypothetical protein